MKICILGDGLTGLTLAKALVKKGVYVDIFSSKTNKKKDKSRTLGISKTNIEFFNKNISNIENLVWNIKNIEIYSENLENQKIINFEKNDQRLFSTLRNYELISKLVLELKKSKFLKFKKGLNDFELIQKKYKLVINCDLNNRISKIFFYKRFNKNYNSHAYTSIIEHEYVSKNNIAYQTFTKKGPIAFLPISNKETSIVYSLKGDKNLKDVEALINKFNIKYKIKKINKINYFKLKSSNLRFYYYKNILAFGDLLHKVHPLAGQGFNMSLRDIKVLLKLIQSKIDNGLDVDTTICKEFENQSRHKNYLFSNGIDFIYEFFNVKNKINNKKIDKFLKIFANKEISNKFFIKLADEGILN